jgi:hypothetical protein
MAVVLPPLAIAAIRLGAAAALVALVAARRGPAPVDDRRETALDAAPEGAGLTIDPDARRADASARWVRAIRLGPNGPGVVVDAAALARVRLRPLRPRR